MAMRTVEIKVEIAAGQTVCFLSDMHLGAAYVADPRAHERSVVEFLQVIEPTCGLLFIVGDALDYWYEYRHVVPRGHVRFFGQLACMADRGVRIVWLTGNHDIWLFDYLRDEIGLEVVDGNVRADINGKKFFISHGDRLGRRPWTMRALGGLFRSKLCQRLYASLHPRWTVGFALRWSLSSRGECRRAEFAGRMRSDVIDYAEGYLRSHPDTDYIVLGHHHVAVDEELPGGARLVILGDWFGRKVYAIFADGHLDLHQIES